MNISAKLDPKYKQDLVDILKEFKDCFAWEYYEMPDLDRSIVEHRLPIKPGYQPFKQAPRRFNPNVLDDIKKEIERLLEAKLSDRADIQNGYRMLSLYIRRMKN